MYSVKMVKDSISPDGIRLSSLELKYPRYIHSELMTHRDFSRNASSSRAIPSKVLIEKSLEEMVEPIKWGVNQSGMQAKEEELTGVKLAEAKKVWSDMANFCAEGSRRLSELGLHKQWSNRPLEWFGNITVLVSSTKWDNFFELRDHKDAQPEIQYLAKIIKDVRSASNPELIYHGQWHLPYVEAIDYELISDYAKYHQGSGDCEELLRRVSAARCCRVSYLKHDGGYSTVSDDLLLCDRLAGSRPIHASPFEHQATPDHQRPYEHTLMPEPGADKGTPSPTTLSGFEWSSPELHGNFKGWIQHRKLIEESFKR